ncbi:type IV toxin-antitoxin system AbiEi family antitoxin domain-containing protein [Haloarcula nitratireducens]|uniref:Type IV toxin-antitoxin system AbiEi family antitoxin domain-containing protein n=1 Tax=Haloarcula nitratireducens TaxID=2487749 RepID=A0AAW4PF25_9EURY|nr:type IV toxin-antitoxin system AbiEi family antitoxin domain-containing protein [Halomicroarcula nitratireducens]MBX0296657.1 type IV toxin-antitoxin system AbiEi family antitoxin domain-containing protein [Halomicroarcula nitratireducens]
MPNENYEPTAKDEQVLDALKAGRDAGQPWGRANPKWLVEQTDLDKGNIEFCLRNLRNAGWVKRVARGLYEFVEDPRTCEGGD